MKMLHVKLDDATHRRFKLACVAQDVDMSELIRVWIDDYLKNVEKTGGVSWRDRKGPAGHKGTA